MALLFSNSLILNLFFLSLFPFIHSLSTIAISETSNQTLVCALIHQSPNQQSFLNCSSFPQGLQIPNVTFSGIVAGNGFLCGLRTISSSSTSTIHCWRFSTDGTNMYHKRIYKGPALNELEAGNDHICGLVNGTNRLQCWQWPEFNSTTTMAQNYSTIAVGESFVCGLSESGTISIAGNDTGVINQVPGGNYGVVAAGFQHACAITVDGGLNCWSDMVGDKPQGKFTSLALGENRSCALWVNETVVCWGENNFSLPESLRGDHFITIEAKKNVFCGVLSVNYSLYCWGNENINSNFAVFQNVLPGPCKSSCPCQLDGSGNLCDQGSIICLPCLGGNSAEESLPPLPLASPPQSQEESRGSGWNERMVAFLVVGCVGSLALVLVLSFFLFRFCKGRGCRIHDSGRLDETGTPAEAGSSQRQAPQGQPGLPVLEKRLSQLASMGTAGSLEEFSFQVLLEATNNFCEDHKIGTGSFGTVYHGTLEDGREVAIKRAEISSNSSYGGGIKRQVDNDNAFVNELESLSRLNHKNLVRLLGFCEDCNELVLVYEYMNNGSLHDHLHKLQSSPLTSWAGRIKVALDAARGIAYLHEYAVPQIIHRDIKSSNILLDATWTAKVSDFGLSLMGPGDDESHLSLHAAGTVGYMDPEYFRLQQLTTKSDVYSFGIVLLELLSGYRAIHKNENGMPRNVVDFVVPYIVADDIHRVLDPKVPPPTPFEIEAVAHVGYLAADCVTLGGRDRPSMMEIVNNLERALAACLIHPALSRSTTRSST